MELQFSPAWGAMQITTIVLFVAIGAAGLAQAPRDPRAQVFFSLALVNGIAAAVPIALWFLEISDWQAFRRGPMAVMLAAFVAGEIALFHFTQLFPARRHWLRASGVQLPVAYAVAPVVAFGLALTAPARPEDASSLFIVVALVFGFPLVVLVAFVLPVASIVSLIRSSREAAESPRLVRLRSPLSAMALSLLGSIAGGLLAGLLRGSDAADLPAWGALDALGWLLGLVFPFAYAVAVWRYGALEVPLEPSAEAKPD